MDFQNFKKFNEDRILMVPRCPTKNLGPIGSAVLTFIGYKQTDKQTNKQIMWFLYKRNLQIYAAEKKTKMK